MAVGCCVGGAPAFGGEDTLGDAPYQAGTPFTYLFDTGSPSPRLLSPRALEAKDGWRLVAEDNTGHEFQGDVVLLNDKLTVVLRMKGPGAEVYSQTAGGAKFRAVVMSAPRKAVAVTGISSVRIEENSPGAVMLDATFEADGGSARCSASYRLTTGQAMLEMTGGEAADRFFVWCKTRYVVVPDFFADDVVFTAAGCDLSRFGLPTESFLLNLIDGGDAILMCVWRSQQREAYAILTGEGPKRVIRGCEIEGGEQGVLSVALLEAADIWCERTATAEQARDGPAVEWKPPFDAKWRLDRVSGGLATVSYDLSKAELEESLLREPDRRNTDAGVRGLPDPPPREVRSSPIILYPLDRNAATPLTAFCPVDVLRNTLGVGPCQYILQTEGLASDADLTPDQVMSWVEKQFKKQRDQETAHEIQAQLGQMAGHVERAQARIDRYAAFAREIQSLGKTEQESREQPGAARTLRETAAFIERIVAEGRRMGGPPERAAELADEIAGLIGKDGALAECQRLGLEVRRIGASQDRTLSKCRMAVRWLKQQARTSMLRDPGSAELAAEVRAQAERFLQDK